MATVSLLEMEMKKKNNRDEICSSFQSLCSEKNADSFRFLAQTSHTSEWMWKIYFSWIAILLIMNVIVAPIIILYYLMINGKLDADNFYRPIPFV